LNTMEYPDLPRVAVGALVFRGESGVAREVLLVRRSKPPHAGVWALPGGAVVLGETLEQAVEREVFEETGVSVSARGVVHAFDAIERDVARRVSYHYVVVDVLAEWIEGSPCARDDAADARWVPLAEVQEMSRAELSDQTRRVVLEFARDRSDAWR